MAVVEYSPVTAPVEVLTEREKRARTLEAAALEIEMRGWHQGWYQLCDGGPVCAVGALWHASGNKGSVNGRWEHGFVDSLGLGRYEPGKSEALFQWNDAPERTAEEVTFLLRWRAEEIRDGWDA